MLGRFPRPPIAFAVGPVGAATLRSALLMRLSHVLLLAMAIGFVADSAAEDSWPEFRGPTQQGQAPDANPPLTWFQGKDRQSHIKYATEIPGRGWSSPV